MPEQCQDLLEGLVLRFRYLFVCEYPEDCEQHAKRQKRVILQRILCKNIADVISNVYTHLIAAWLSIYLQCGKADADHKVRRPIHQHRNRHGTGPRALREQLSGDHPRYRARTDGEEDDEGQHRDDGQVAHPVDHFLHITKKLLNHGCNTRFSTLARLCHKRTKE